MNQPITHLGFASPGGIPWSLWDFSVPLRPEACKEEIAQGDRPHERLERKVMSVFYTICAVQERTGGLANGARPGDCRARICSGYRRDGVSLWGRARTALQAARAHSFYTSSSLSLLFSCSLPLAPCSLGTRFGNAW